MTRILFWRFDWTEQHPNIVLAAIGVCGVLGATVSRWLL